MSEGNPGATSQESEARTKSPFLTPGSWLLTPVASVVRSDCLAFLGGLPDASVDVIVTDPWEDKLL
jgi:hypothetical protein